MTLNEFVNHIKHNSLDINVFCDIKEIPFYHGTFGTYKSSVYKQKYGNIEISKTYPMFMQDDTFNILLDSDCAKAYLEDLEKIDRIKEGIK